MRTAMFLVLAGQVLPAGTVPLERKGAYIVVSDVRVNGHGPFRFLIDTGAQSVAVTERVARASGLVADSRVEQATVAGVRLVEASHARTITVGRVTLERVEALIGGLDAVTSLDTRIDGVLGQSFLRRLDYLIDYDRGELMLGAAGLCGSAVPLHDVEGRPGIQAQIDGASRKLVIDSGAPALILFGGRSQQTALVSTNAGQTRATVGTRVIRIGERKYRLMTAEMAGDQSYGLLPAGAFRSLYVNNSEGYVVFGDKAQSGSCSGSSGRSG